MSTSFTVPIQAFFRRIENDKSFFNYYNIDATEAMALASERAYGYLIESISKISMSYSTDIDFTNYTASVDENGNSSGTFNFDLTKNEIALLAQLMYEQYFNRDFVKLRAFKLQYSPSDLNTFSPANERKTFIEMYDKVKLESQSMLDNYISRDRLTNQLKTINYAKYFDINGD
mgnify:CR=1 FL=1|jgi:hypothetical protein